MAETQTQQYDDNMRGVLFYETEKKNDKGPDLTGEVTVAGTKYRLAGWKRTSRGGRDFLSLSVSDFVAREGQGGQGGGQGAGKPAAKKTETVDDEIPF